MAHLDDQPAPSDGHWAFAKPVSPSIPEVRHPAWANNQIDRFVLVRLDAERLIPSPLADRTSLVRRLSLDLIGLPPSPADVDDVVADPAPDALERLTDRLFASPHFGEKWAIRWLDLARYADSNGFEFDAVRSMWLYRDWVIAALNSDMPFDQFTAEQLAGDLLPGADVQQRVATGFLRCSPVAPDIATHRFDMIVDRVNTVGTTWLGLTVSCAQCHDHPFDPITQQEYFELYAIFNNSVDEVDGATYAGKEVTAASPLTGVRATTLVIAERPQPNVTHFKIRGAPEADGDVVAPAVPKFLHPARCSGEDRLALACWLIDDDNPLTGRVTVNRLWESLFGAGLVRTSDDFGTRGENPTHPELLDWLAVEFRQSGWSQKRMLRAMVASSTYRQAARTTPELLERDPQNRLLARGPRFRVDAELIRDIALAASGLLADRLGGPSVFPWQPPGTSENLEFAAFAWNVNPDDNRYRRGIYTHWKRTALYPTFVLFDAPNRTATCARRHASCTPLQALATLNDPVFFEAAVHLGRRMLVEGGGTKDWPAVVSRGFRLCLARPPTEDESAKLLTLLQEELQRHSSDEATASAQVGGDAVVREFADLNVAEWAACSTIANVLLNLDETITKE